MILKNKFARWARWGVLAFMLALVTYESIMHQVLGGWRSPSVHALCPYGALESLYALVFSGNYIQKIYLGTLILLIVTVAIALLFRRSFCGLLCPFGALQEFFARIGHRKWKIRPVMPVRLDSVLRYLKYILLILTAGMAWRLGRLWMSSFDPYSAYSHITVIPGTIAEDPLSIIGFVLLGITLVGSLVYDRFFCKYLCPAGAFYAIVGKVSPTKIVRDDQTCIHCNLCTKVCPVNIDVAKLDQVTSAECLSCNECVAVCPKAGVLAVRTFKKTLSPLLVLLLVVALFFIPIGIAQAAGVYQLTNEGVKSETASGEAGPEQSDAADATAQDDAAAQGDAAAQLEKIDITSVKGSMSIADASGILGISQDEFYVLFKIPTTVDAKTRMKDIANVSPGYDFDAVKDALG